VDARGFVANQILTGFTIRPGVTVILPPVTFTLVASGGPVTVNEGARLVGGGTNSPGSTILQAPNGFNKNVLECVAAAGKTNTWWHHGLVEWIRIEGNKANNSSGHGLGIWGVGEVSQVRNCIIQNCANACLYIYRSQAGTGSINNVTVNGGGQYGILFDALTSGLTLYNVGGDSNPILIGIINGSSGAALLFVDVKCETNGLATEICHISGGGGNSVSTITFVGGNVNSGSTAGTTFFTIDADVQLADHKINILGLATDAQMTNLIKDNKRNITVTQAGSVRHAFFAYDGSKSPPIFAAFSGIYTVA